MASIDELLNRTMVLVAHQDDECVAFGGLLQRIRHPLVVFATDGAPEDPYFWERYGSREAYAALRRREALQAMSYAGVKDVIFMAELPGGQRFIDQQLFHNLNPAFHLLLDLMMRRLPTAVLTLAYEGGHPDHDSCSFLAAQLAAALSIPCWEAPLYRRVKEGEPIHQEFFESAENEFRIEPNAQELEQKRKMCVAYSSQGDFLKHFNLLVEPLRPQKSYDYTQPPHAGKTNYEMWQWNMTAEQVSKAFSDFLQAHSAASTRRR